MTTEKLEDEMKQVVMRVFSEWRQSLPESSFPHSDGVRFKLRVEAAIGVVVGQFQRDQVQEEAQAS